MYAFQQASLFLNGTYEYLTSPLTIHIHCSLAVIIHMNAVIANYSWVVSQGVPDSPLSFTS